MTARPPLPGPLDARAVGAMLLLDLTWSLQQVSLKAIAPLASPVLVVALRSALALALLALLMRARGEGISRRRLGPGLLVGALFGLEYLLVAEALRWTQAAQVVVFLYTAPVFAALGLHWRLPAERLQPLQWAGIALAFGGIAWAFLGGQATAHGPAAAAAWRGDALALAGGAAWGATTVAIRSSSMAQAPATEMLAWQLAGAVALLLPGAWLTGGWHFSATATVWLHLGFQALVVSLASFLLWCALLRRYLAAPLGVLAFLTPVFGVLLGALLLGERLSAPFLAGSAAVLAGVLLVSAQGLRAVRAGFMAPSSAPCPRPTP